MRNTNLDNDVHTYLERLASQLMGGEWHMTERNSKFIELERGDRRVRYMITKEIQPKVTFQEVKA